MNWLEFLASAIESAAWPLAVTAIVFLLRRPLAQLIPLLRSLRYKDLELDFATKLEEVENQAEAVGLPPVAPVTARDGQGHLETTGRPPLAELAKTSPRAAIAETWRQLEHDVRVALQRQGSSPPSNTLRMLQEAEERGILPSHITNLVADLRGLRNRALHGQELQVDLAGAIQYIELTDRVRAALPPPAD